MKPAAAFSIGLWTGAAVIAAVGVFYLQQSSRTHSGLVSATDSQLAAATEKAQLLEQDNARLNAEVQSLRETAEVLKSNMEEKAVLESTPRRIPFRMPTPQAETPSGTPRNWMEQAVATGDISLLPELEKAARANNHRALEAIALLADRDQSAALTRVWRSGTLTPPNQADATRYLAATMEVNPDAEQLLRALVADPTTDVHLLYAAVDGFADPAFRVSLGRDIPLQAPPHFRPDYAARMRMLEIFRSSSTDENLRAYIDQAKTDLQARWAEANPTAP